MSIRRICTTIGMKTQQKVWELLSTIGTTEEMKIMTIEFDVTEQDYLDFNLFHFDHSKHEKRTRLILRYAANLFIDLLYRVTSDYSYRGIMDNNLSKVLREINKKFCKKIHSRG